MQKSQLLGKYRPGSTYSPKTTSYLAGSSYSPKTTSYLAESNYNQNHNNLSDYLVKSKYGKVVQTALYQQNYVVFEFQTGGISTPETSLLDAPLAQNFVPRCSTMTRVICLN